MQLIDYCLRDLKGKEKKDKPFPKKDVRQRCETIRFPRKVSREIINHMWQMLDTLLNCRCSEAKDNLRIDSLKNRTFNAFSDPGKSGEPLFEGNGSSSRI